MRKTHFIVGVIAVLALALPVWASWTDDFTGGTADQTWTFNDNGGNGATLISGTSSTSSPTYSIDVNSTPDYLHITANDLPASGPIFVAGTVGESFTDVVVRGYINVENPGSNNDVGLLARGNVALGNGYLLSLDLVSGSLNISKSQFGSVNDIGSPGSIAVDDTQSYYLEFIVTGSSTVNLIGNIYDEMNGMLLASTSATDETNIFTEGFSGVAAAVNSAAAIPTPVNATFSQISAVIPEPASVLLFGAGMVAIFYRRR